MSYIPVNIDEKNIDEIHEDFIFKKAKKGIKKTTKTVKKGVNKTTKTVKKGVNKVGKATLGGIMKVINEIFKIMKKVAKFLLNIDDFFKNWGKAVKFMTNPKKAMAIVLTATIPVLGQLFARFMLYNGSMNHPWLFLFAIPPFTLVPVFAMMFGYIKKLKGGSPWDNVVWVPLIANTIGAVLVKNNKNKHIIKFALTIGSFMLAYWYKSKLVCKGKSAKSSKIALDSIISYMFVLVLALVLPHLPFVGNVFSAIEAVVPYSDILFQAFAVFLAYVGTNIVNGNVPGVCGKSYKEDDIYKVMIAAVFLTAITAFAPGSPTSIMMNMM